MLAFHRLPAVYLLYTYRQNAIKMQNDFDPTVLPSNGHVLRANVHNAVLYVRITV